MTVHVKKVSISFPSCFSNTGFVGMEEAACDHFSEDLPGGGRPAAALRAGLAGGRPEDARKEGKRETNQQGNTALGHTQKAQKSAGREGQAPRTRPSIQDRGSQFSAPSCEPPQGARGWAPSARAAELQRRALSVKGWVQYQKLRSPEKQFLAIPYTAAKSICT